MQDAKALVTKQNIEIEEIITWADYIEHATFDPTIQQLRYKDLMDFSRTLHDFMRDHAKLTESEKPLLVSGTLIALENAAFVKSYDAYTPEDLQKQWLKVIADQIEHADLPQAKKLNMTQPYSTIAVHPELGKETRKYPRGVLFELIKMLDQKVRPFVSVYHDFDVVGQFYGEFLKYTGGDKKSLGIVLTPRHITDLCARLANVNKNSAVIDICAGTGGFLISAMHRMIAQAITTDEKERIKEKGLIGIEQQPNMYALAASNMILRGDGKANLYQGSCFTDAIIMEIKEKFECDVGLLNPPFSQGDADLHELVFVRQMLSCLVKGGTGIAVVPVSCAISPHPFRAALMKEHTLEAVMSLPDVFHPVGVIVCLMVWTAHVPHETSDRKTWFGYWRDDGFVKTKHRGRVDVDHNWPAIRDRWVTGFRNREVHPGESVMQRVGIEDEWCAEAYMETDYSTLIAEDFSTAVRAHLAARLKLPSPHSAVLDNAAGQWRPFRLGELFEIKKGKRLTKANMLPGSTPFIGAIDDNNGLTAFVGQSPIHDAGTITVNYNGNGVAEAFYQAEPFWASDDVNVLYPRFKMTSSVALFICTVIRKEKYRFNYGRKWHKERMEQSEIRLPVTPSGVPDFGYMETFIKALPFGDNLN
jgi:type I restriction enzyme M protein